MRMGARYAAVAALATLVLAAGLGAGPVLGAAGTTVTVTNGGAPGWIRFDDQGNGVDVHDGEIKQFSYVDGANGPTRYYLYGTSYGCGYVRMHGYGPDHRPVTPFCGFVAYESTDLRHWKYDGPLFDPHGTTPTNWQKTCDSATLSCYRPHVLYDFATGYYRLWVNTYDVAGDGTQHGYHVLSSRSPTGPFVEDADSSGRAVLPRLGYPTGGDFDLFQDNDRTGYIVYTVRSDPLGGKYGYKLVLEKLSPHYKTGTGVYTGLDTRHTEAPSMFRRGHDYYISMADPYCAYCAGTGTAYLRASSPLGPWRGVGGQAAPSHGQLYVDGLTGLLQGSSAGLRGRLAGLGDYQVAFRARPTSGTGRRSRVGWMFRAHDARNGYLWVLSNVPTGGDPARLTRQVVRNGAVVRSRVVGVPARLSSTSMNVVRTSVTGSRIRTWLNGRLVDATTDTAFRRGFAGVREPPGSSAYFDDVSVGPASAGAQPYAAADFATGSLAAFPALDRYRRHGVRISATSCGGQPDDVAMLRAPNTAGWEYLYESDRWDHGDQNEGQATQYWEPLRFTSSGALRALMCGKVFRTVLTDATASSTALDLGAAGTDGFTAAQDITATRARGQTFQVSGTADLQSLQLTLFQGDDTAGNGPDAGLQVAVYDYDGDPTMAGPPLVPPVTVPRTTLGWSPRTVSIPLAAPLAGNPNGSAHTYAIVLRTASRTGVYGTARSDGTADTYPAGAGLVGKIDPASSVTTWTREQANDLRFAVTLATSGSPPAP